MLIQLDLSSGDEGFCLSSVSQEPQVAMHVNVAGSSQYVQSQGLLCHLVGKEL